MERVRKIDVNKLEADQVDALSEQIGEKLKEIVDKACSDANRIVSIYGMQVKMQFLLEELTSELKEE